VFEEFVRLEGPPDSSGSGLGLAIARAFVVAHGGRIEVEPTPGGGATFVVAIPDETVAA
jgi:two-component system OmpR family sensor kinase